MTLRVWSPTAGAVVRLKLEDAADATHTVEADATATVANAWQTLTFNFANQATGTTALNLAYTFNKASIFMGFGSAGTGQTYYVDDLTFMGATTATPSPAPAPVASGDPTTNAPTPTKAAANVISVFSDAYTNIGVSNWFPNWGQSTVVSDIAISGNNIKKYTNLNYQGVELMGPTNVSTMANLHIDVYSTTTDIKVSLIANTTPVTEQAYTIKTTTAGWNSFDIPLSSYSTLDKTKIFQLKFDGVTTGNTVYFDNLYFWK